MKRFIKKTTLFIVPILICFGVAEYLLRHIPNDYSYKNYYLNKNAQNVEALFLGSSHTYYGINPEYYSGNGFNASHISQSIDLDYELINKYSGKFEKLKFIVMPIDYFSLYGRTSAGIESWRMKNYNIYYDLNVSINPKQYFELFSFSPKKNAQRIVAHYIYNKNYITCSKFGYGITDIKQNEDIIGNGKEAALRHTKADKKYLEGSIRILDDMISYAEKKDIIVLFYTTPAYQSYRDNLDLDQYHMTVKTIDSISRSHNNSYYFNFMADDNFKKHHFRDADHLNKQGAKLLTEILNRKISEIKQRH